MTWTRYFGFATVVVVMLALGACSGGTKAPGEGEAAPGFGDKLKQGSDLPEAADAAEGQVGHIGHKHGKQHDKKAEEPAAPPADPAPAPAAEGEAAPSPAAAAPAAAVDPLQQKLFGTSWKIDEFEASFIDAAKMKIKGGPLKDLMPQGLDAKYTFKLDENGKGQITVSALGNTKTGTWDGEKLVLDGTAAVKL